MTLSRKYRPPFLRHPRVYRAVCKSYLQLRAFLFASNIAVQVSTAVSAVLIAFIIRNDIPLAVYSTIAFYVILFSLLGILYLIINLMIHTGTQDKFIFPGVHLLRLYNGAPCEIVVDGIDSSNFEFATEQTAAITAELNVKAFNDTPWKDSLEKKYERNLAHIKKNKRSILLIKDSKGKFIGFTHVLLVTEATWNKYLNGRISDNRFSEKLIVPTTCRSKNDKPYGLILFSVAITERNRDFDDPDTYADSLGLLLEKALVFHFKSYCEKQFKGTRTIPILIQNMSSNFWSFFEKCSTEGKKISADGVRIICFEVSNPFK